MEAASYMRADTRQVIGGTPDLSPLIGEWVNTSDETDYIVKIIIEDRNGRLMLRAYGADSPNPIDWGETEATPYVAGGTMESTGFHARYDFGSIETFLVANQKLGILVIQSYTEFKDGSGRMSHYAREFFHR